MGMTLLDAAQREYLTPLKDFGPTSHVYHRTYVTNTNVYLLVADPALGEGSLVYGAGWACNPYWAVEAWGFNGRTFRNEFDPAAPRERSPSLESVGLPIPLRYSDVVAAAKLSGLHVPVSVAYRGTDGSFETHQIGVQLKQRWTLHYDDPNPEPSDEPAAIEVRLGGPRWDQFLAERARANKRWLNPAPRRGFRWRRGRSSA